MVNLRELFGGLGSSGTITSPISKANVSRLTNKWRIRGLQQIRMVSPQTNPDPIITVAERNFGAGGKYSRDQLSQRNQRRNGRNRGFDGNDVVNGGAGNDIINGSRGNDTLNGGQGRDTAQFSSRSNRINLNTTGWQNTGDGKDRLISIENVNAGSGNDVIIGNRIDNILNGQAGNDRLYGGGGDDLLIGGGGKDRVWGQGGRDTFRVVRGNGYTIIEDFQDGIDRIQLGSGRALLRLVSRGDDVLLYQRNDLMAVVEDAAGDLRLSGSYLV